MRHSANLKSMKQVEALDAQKKGRVTMKEKKVKFYSRNEFLQEKQTLQLCRKAQMLHDEMNRKRGKCALSHFNQTRTILPPLSRRYHGR